MLDGGHARSSLTCDGGAAYELGKRERDHGIALQPFRDGELAAGP